MIERCFAFIAGLIAGAGNLHADEWTNVLGRMPLASGVREVNRTNCVDVMLNAFQSNATVKALIFMPGATDELYFFHRVNASITNDAPTLLDAVAALTNQTYIRATWRAPMLLLRTQEDPVEPLVRIENEHVAAKLCARSFLPHALYNDHDWDHLRPILARRLNVRVRPWHHSYEANHFYRHSFAAWNLSGWEALEAVALAGKTQFTVERWKVVFEGDPRQAKPPPEVPTLESFHRLIQPRDDAATNPAKE